MRWWRPTTGLSAGRIAKPPGACEAQLGDETAAVREALRAFAELGTALLAAHDACEALDAVIAEGPGWEGLGDLVAKAAGPASSMVVTAPQRGARVRDASDPAGHVRATPTPRWSVGSSASPETVVRPLPVVGAHTRHIPPHPTMVIFFQAV